MTSFDDLDDELITADAQNDLPKDADFIDQDGEDDSGAEDDYAALTSEDPVRKAQDVVTAWEAEQATAKAALAEAEKAWVDTEKRFDADEVDHADRLKAQQGIIDARVRLTEAERETYRARNYAETAQQTQPSPAARDWMARNPRFASDARFKEQADTAFKALVKEGFDPTNPKLYERLDQRLRSTPRMQGKPGTSGGAVTRTSGGRDERGNQVSAREAQWIAKFGLNPKDQRHTKLWNANKAELARLTGQGG